MKTKLFLTFGIIFFISIKVYSQPTLWGASSTGGTSWNGLVGYGNLFKIPTGTGSLQSLYNFTGVPDGALPFGSLMRASNGKLYGMTNNGGLTTSLGVLYEFNPVTNIFTKKIDFDGINGIFPYSTLIEVSNGKLYGATRSNIFEYDISNNKLTSLAEFDGNNGWNTLGSLVEDSNGKLYGITQEGGAYNFGVLYEFDISNNTITKKVDFDGTNGKIPYANLIQATNGKLYGMTSEGGLDSIGVIFEYDISGDTLTVIHHFTDDIFCIGPDCYGYGMRPYGSLLQATNGKLYGMTSQGGKIFSPTASSGILFSFNVDSNLYTINQYFDFQTTGSLMEASNGKLYGVISGSLGNLGSIFEYEPQVNSLVTKYSFSGIDGAQPHYQTLIETNCIGTVPAQPGVISVTGGIAKICSGESRTYTTPVASGVSYFWYIPKGIIINSGQGTNAISVTFDTSFVSGSIISVEKVNSCGSSTPRNITVNKNYPTAVITTNGAPTTFCSGSNPLMLTASAGAGYFYQWKKGANNIAGATNQSYVPTTTSSSYKVVITNTPGCSKTSAVVPVTVNPLPSASISVQGPTTTFCSGSNVVLQANTDFGLTYQWKKGTSILSGQTNYLYTATATGVYKVTVTNQNSCSKTSGTISVTAITPVATITPQGPTTFCAGGNVVLQANSGAGLTYQWKKGNSNIPGAILQSYTAATAGTYKVIVTDANGCTKISNGTVVTVNCRETEAGINEINMEIFPNPTNGLVTLQFSLNKNTNCEIEIADITGRKVIQKSFSAKEGLNDNVVDLSRFDRGIYLMKVKTNEGEYIKRIILQ